MKWTTHELAKLVNINNQIEQTVDLSSYIKNTDIVKISPVKVSGEFEIYDQEEYIFYLDIKCELTLQCAITLDEVIYPLDISTEEVFTTFKDDNSNYIEGITIDLLPIVWSNIILEKPMRVVSENAYDNFEQEYTEFEDEDHINKAFASLKNYKN